MVESGEVLPELRLHYATIVTPRRDEWAQDEGGDKSNTPAEQYKTLLKEYQDASGGGAASDEERMRFVGRVYKLRYKIALKFLELAERNPMDPIALDALIQAVWQVNNIPWPAELVGTDSAGARAFATLQRDHVRSDKLGPVCQRISVGFSKEYETFLRTVLGVNPRAKKGREMFSLLASGICEKVFSWVLQLSTCCPQLMHTGQRGRLSA